MIRQAQHEDIDSIMTIVGDAQRALAELGIDQWQDGYPTRDIILEDIDLKQGYVYEDATEGVVGYSAIVLTGEEAYNQIKGSEWNTSDDYIVIHRLCVRNVVRRKGVASELMQFAITKAQEAKLTGFRIDTHNGNVRMLSLLEAFGFKHIGRILYDSGEREAFDLKLDLNNTL